MPVTTYPVRSINDEMRLMSLETIITFILITIVATVTPGPTMLYIASCGLSHGSKGYLPASLGVLVADFIYFLLTVTGLGVILLASHELFFLIKWLGVLYLVYLGVKLIFSNCSTSIEKNEKFTHGIVFHHAFLKGFVVHLANPKTMLFFGALLPQFIDLEKPMLLQVLIISFILLFTQAIVSIAYGVMGEHIRTKLRNSYIGRRINIISGLLFIGAGVWLATIHRE